MIIFLYGKDTYRMRQKFNEIVEQYKKVHKSGLSLKYLDFSEKNALFSDFKDGFRQASMFKEKKLILTINPFSSISFKESFLEQGKSFLDSDDLIVFYQEGEIDKRTSLFKFLLKNAKCQEFKSLTGQKLRAWLKKEFQEYKTDIELNALEKLIDYAGSDLWALSNESKKLASYAKGREIKTEDVETLVKSKIEADIFKSIDAIAQRNKKQALKLIHKHLERGDSPLYLLTMINYQFRNLLLVKDFIEKHKPYDVILRKSGLHPFVVKKSYYQCQQFSLAELKKIYQKIFKVDFEIKTGKIEPTMALDLLVTEI